MLNPSIGDKKYDLVICSGSRTVMPAYLVSIKTKAKIVYIGTPKFRVMKKFNGIICGHIHHAENLNLDGVNYLNCGDWVESCTALAEKYDGTFEIIYWDKIRQNFILENLETKKVSDFKRAS